MYQQFTRGSFKDWSAIPRLGADFSAVSQLQCKFKLHLDLKPMRGKEVPLPESYRLERRGLTAEYEEYKKSEGGVHRAQIELLVECFLKNSGILVLKLSNLTKPRNSINFVRNLVDTLVLRGLRSKQGVAEFSLLVALRNAGVAELLSRCL
jgi:hypothetical protein